MFEDASESPASDGFTRQPYRLPRPATPTAPATSQARPTFALRASDTSARPARLRVYTGFTTTQAAFISGLLPALRIRYATLRPEGVELVIAHGPRSEQEPAGGVQPAMEAARAPRESSRRPRRAEAANAFAAAVPGLGAGALASVITDDAGRILAAQAGMPSGLGARTELLAESGTGAR